MRYQEHVIWIYIDQHVQQKCRKATSTLQCINEKDEHIINYILQPC